MVYKDFLNAARKHKYTCNVLFEHLENETNTGKHKSLLLNSYYLSGYIIECIVKYAIYDLIGYQRNRDIKKLDEKGLTFDEHIKHHKFERYTEHLNRLKSIPIPLINNRQGIANEVVRLYREWDADVRYSYDLKYEKSHYIEFYKCAGKIFDIIKNNVKG